MGTWRLGYKHALLCKQARVLSKPICEILRSSLECSEFTFSKRIYKQTPMACRHHFLDKRQQRNLQGRAGEQVFAHVQPDAWSLKTYCSLLMYVLKVGDALNAGVRVAGTSRSSPVDGTLMRRGGLCRARKVPNFWMFNCSSFFTCSISRQVRNQHQQHYWRNKPKRDTTYAAMLKPARKNTGWCGRIQHHGQHRRWSPQFSSPASWTAPDFLMPHAPQSRCMTRSHC